MSRACRKLEYNNHKEVWWEIVSYTESEPENAVEILTNTGYQCARSEEHNGDTYEEDDPELGHKKGDPKKPHYHNLINCGKKTKYKDIMLIAKQLGTTQVSKIHGTPLDAFKYLSHANAPEKCQYGEPTLINGFLVPLDEQSTEEIITDIRRSIILEDITEFTELTSRCATINRQYATICRKNQFYFDKLLTSYRNNKFVALNAAYNEFADYPQYQQVIEKRLLYTEDKQDEDSNTVDPS